MLAGQLFTLCLLDNFAFFFCPSADFCFQNQPFLKIFQEYIEWRFAGGSIDARDCILLGMHI